MTAALEAPRSFPDASQKFHEQTRKSQFMEVRCVEHGVRVCATVVLKDFLEEFPNTPEAFQMLSGSKTVGCSP